MQKVLTPLQWEVLSQLDVKKWPIPYCVKQKFSMRQVLGRKNHLGLLANEPSFKLWVYASNHIENGKIKISTQDPPLLLPSICSIWTSTLKYYRFPKFGLFGLHSCTGPLLFHAKNHKIKSKWVSFWKMGSTCVVVPELFMQFPSLQNAW